MILVIDNYDSFVFNLARYINELGCETHVVRNDALSLDAIVAEKPEAIVLSPGPGRPESAGLCVPVVQRLGQQVPILGICLGHQAIGAALGGHIVRASEPIHGRTSTIVHDGQGLFQGIKNPLTATRYHSLIIDEARLPPELTIRARTEDGVVMAIQHNTWPIFGLQFHPETILTEAGHGLLANFLRTAGLTVTNQGVGDYTPHNAATRLTDGDVPSRPLHW